MTVSFSRRTGVSEKF